MSNTETQRRYAPCTVDEDGVVEFRWQLTPSHITDPVYCVLPPPEVLPVIFVPGIMGSNLRNKKEKNPVWRLDNSKHWNWGLTKDKPIDLVFGISSEPGARQKILHPALVEVDPDGATPAKAAGSVTKPAAYIKRGWGEIGEGSYHRFLLWLDDVLNGHGYMPHRWPDFLRADGAHSGTASKLPPGIAMHMADLPKQGEKGAVHLSSDELLARANFRMPVYAFGYNWLDDNAIAADLLQERISKVIAENNNKYSHCSQVILITHSMGGLVARACQKLPGMSDKIAGIVHGVMPAVGAAVAYRRCKIGMLDEDAIAGMAIGNNGRAVTAVFAQAPGALQLLPTRQYRPDWLGIRSESGKSVDKQPASGDPYEDIYLRRNRWWGLIREEWLSPPGGEAITWNIYEQNMKWTREFHDNIENTYHPNTYVFYGNDLQKKSFETVQWDIEIPVDAHDTAKAAQGRPTPEQVSTMHFREVVDRGSNPLGVARPLTPAQRQDPYSGLGMRYWNLRSARQDGGGDGTVPISSGRFPLRSGGDCIQQQFGIGGISHESAYHNKQAQAITLYAIQKIAAKAKVRT